MIYFDHNATTPILPEARQAWLEAGDMFPGNPSSPHRIGARADAALQTAREKVAGLLGCHALDLVWTSGATEANNMALHHAALTLPPRAEVWVSAIEHPCILNATRHYFPKRHQLIPVLKTGLIDLEWLRHSLSRRHPGLVAVMAANNETGVVQPWREILALCREWGVPFFCDAAQWLGKLPAAGLGACDFVSGSAHKFGGPKGIGFLKCQGLVKPLLLGGMQEDGRRAGTENVAGAVALGTALAVRERLLEDNAHEPRLDWRQRFEAALRDQLPGSEVVGAGVHRLWNTVTAVMPDRESQQRWVVKLDKAGCAVSTGSACASGREEPSHVLAAMGYSPLEIRRVLRFSSGWETTENDWQTLLAGVLQVGAAM